MSEEDLSPRSRTLLHILRKYFSKVGGEGFRIADFTYQAGNVIGALVYAPVFVPEFQVVEGFVILDDDSRPAGFLKALGTSTMNPHDLADSFNWVEVPYLFANKEMFCDDDKDEDEDELLAEFIAEAWRGRLLTLFPDRKFIVEVIPPDPTGVWWA